MCRCTSNWTPGRREPNEKKRTPPTDSSSHARARKSFAPVGVYGGSVTTVSKLPAKGSRRSARTHRNGNGASASSCRMKSTRRSSTSTTTSSSIRMPKARVKRSSATEIRSSFAEQDDSSPGDRVRLVHREGAAQLRLRRAVALVELDARRRSSLGGGGEPPP